MQQQLMIFNKKWGLKTTIDVLNCHFDNLLLVIALKERITLKLFLNTCLTKATFAPGMHKILYQLLQNKLTL